jgi:hypothetical protein
MAQSVGHNHLGMDPSTGHGTLSPAINAAIEAYDTKTAFDTTLGLVRAVIGKFSVLKQPDPSGPARIPIDLVTLSESVLAALCSLWVGLPEGSAQLGLPGPAVPAGKDRLMTVGGRLNGSPAGPPRCPGHLLTPSRFIFTPHPRSEAEADGKSQGDAVKKAVEKALAEQRPLGPLAKDIQGRLTALGQPVDVIANAIAGVLLGFPPTVHGNFLQTMDTWIDTKALWSWQQRWVDAGASQPDAYGRARSALFGGLMDTMRKRPVPEMLWRCPVGKDGKPIEDKAKRQVLGIGSALTDPNTSYMLMFGGSRDSKRPDWGLHACPGYEMGVGVMLALIAGLLDAGTLRPTGSPVLLMLTPRA